MHTMESLVAAALLATALAGCVVGQTSTAAGDWQAFDAETGAIEGGVADSSLLPIVQATINATGDSGPALIASTDETGRYSLRHVAPGDYEVEISAAGFESYSITVAVAAGSAASASAILRDVATEVPFVNSHHQRGHNACAVAFIVDSLQAGAYCDSSTDHTRLFFDIPTGFSLVLLETTWDQQDEEMVQWLYCCDDHEQGRTVLDNAWGLPPTRTVFEAGAQKEKPPSSVAVWDYGPVPDGQAFALESWGYWTGPNAEYTNPTLQPACNQFTYDRCSGVGVTLGFAYDSWTSTFVNGIATDPDSFSALPDQ